MKTIVYLISTLHRTGPTNVLAGIVKNLDKTHFRPVIITLSPEPDNTNSWWQELESQGIEIYSLQLTRLSGVFLAKKFLERLFSQIHPDIIHTHCFRSTVLASHFKNYKKVATVHCDYEVDFKLAYGVLKGRLMSILFTRALSCMDMRIACSYMLAELLNKKYPSMHFDFVNNGVDTDKFHPVTDKNTLRAQLNLPQDRKIVVWAGSFIPRKDPLILVQAILQLPENQYYFVFCGARGPLLDTCKELLKHRKDVLFTEYITNIEQYYQAADVYVSTSKSEGLPLAVLEAQFCRLVPLLSDILQHRYIVPPTQFTCCLYNNTVQGLVERMNALLNPENTSLLQSCASHIKQFSAIQMAKNYMEKY